MRDKTSKAMVVFKKKLEVFIETEKTKPLLFSWSGYCWSCG